MTQDWAMFIIGQAVLFGGAIIKIWNDSQVKMARMDERLANAEDKDAILFKTELSIQLSNKQDK
ncbi:MAG: hypothetical protein RLZZ184_3602 [Cyanobacteriota bacterium]